MKINYKWVNFHIDPENHQFLVETNLPTPIWQGRTVNLLQDIYIYITYTFSKLGFIYGDYKPLQLYI